MGNVTGWLEKNKDPVNDTVVDVLKRGTCALMKTCWMDHPGQSAPPDDGKKKKKKGGGKTVASVYLVQLAELMTTLNSTEPHFIRCIVPNTHKKPLETETPLIMHQLTCNGVLEGIRVCMLGFPNRMLYRDYKARYQVLGAEILATAGNDKEGVFKLMTEVEFPAEKYRCGHTMVFFRAGALAALEEARDGIVLKLVRWMQGQAFGRIRRVAYQKKADQRELMKVIQRNFRKYMILRSWGWFVIIQKTKPLVGQQNPEQELAELEELANAKYGAYEDALKTKARLQEENVAAKEEIQALIKQIEAEQGNMSQYTDRQAAATAEKTRLEGVLVETGNLLVQMQQSREDATGEEKELEAENMVIKKDIEDLELAIQKLEQEKTNRDHNIRSLNDEIANQDEVINKLNKEKKLVAENSPKASEDLQVAEDKVSHLNNVKSKLESTFDELEDSLNKEKRARADIEKKRRKIEGDLKVAQETVMDAERGKKELEAGIARKEKDLSGLSSRLEDEQTIVAKAQKAIKETQARVEELEEELEAERQARAKAEGQRSNLARELDQLGGRLTEAGGATAAQIELNKKRDSEIGKLRKDLEEAHIQQESTMMNLKRKHQDAVAEMSEQIDQLSKMKAKIEKDKGAINHEIADVRAATEEINRSKASAEKSNKTLISQLNDANKKVEEANLTLGDFENAKRKMAAENADLLRSVQELENNANIVSKYKIQLVSALDEAKKVADAEAKERQALLGKFKNLEHDLDGSKAMMDEESGAKDDILRQVAKACSEADMTTEQLHGKLRQLDNAKNKIQGEINEVAAQCDQAHILNSSMEKKAKQFDRIVGEWKGKADGLGMDLDVAQKEARNASSELFRVKSAYEESVIQLDEVRKENKGLSNEIKDIMDQISEGGRSIHEIDKICKRLEAEKIELEAALSEAEGALEQEENKVLRAQLELAQVRQEIERRIAEKEEEFASTKKNMGKGLENMQAAVETEAKGKAEALRMKKKLEGDVLDLECNLEHANAANAETQRNIKTYQLGLREAQAKLEGEQLAKEKAHDALIVADRKCNSNQNALEEARTLLEQADRARRMVEQELADTNEALSEQTCQNQAIQASKMKIESEMATLSSDLDEMAAEAGLSEEKAQRAIIDAARLADELRGEQDLAQSLERERKLLDAQVKDMQSRVDEAQTQALKGGKKAMTKMDTRIRELESELDAENRRMADAQKNLRKSERKIKELSYQQDEDRKNHERMQALIDQLQGKIKSYKKQIEEAEEIAALNLAKYRQAQNSVADATERADSNEQALAKNRARARSASIGPM